jgi:hypothetical protein
MNHDYLLNSSYPAILLLLMLCAEPQPLWDVIELLHDDLTHAENNELNLIYSGE